MTNEKRQLLLERLEPTFKEFGISGFAGVLVNWVDTHPRYDEEIEIVRYCADDCPHDTGEMLRYYKNLLEFEHREASIDLEALLEYHNGGYLVTTRVTKQEAYELCVMSSVASTSAGMVTASQTTRSALQKISDCVKKQFSPEHTATFNRVMSAIEVAYSTPSVERGMIQGGFAAMRETITGIIHQQQNDNGSAS